MIRIFVSYSHKDENLRQELETHLSGLRNERIVSVWDDRRIESGEEIEKEIDRHLEEADIVVHAVPSLAAFLDHSSNSMPKKQD